MELIDRYVGAVGERLHPSRRAEVESELRAAIFDALDARGADPAREEDVVAVLAALGEPARMAAGYEPNRWYLIGPDLYPLFRRVLRLVLVALVVASTVGFGLSLLLGGFAELRAGALLVDTLGYAFRAAMVALVVVVAAFAWLQRAEVRLPLGVLQGERPWHPRALPARAGAEPAPRFDVIAGLVVGAIALAILGGIGLAARDAAPHAPAGLRPLLRDGVVTSIVLLQTGFVISTLAHAIALVQGQWRGWSRGGRLIADLLAAFVFLRLPLQLLEHRPALVEAGLPGGAATWLVASAAVGGVIVAGGVGYSWWRALQRSGPGGAEAEMRAPAVT